jgi:hypothetical protein
MPSAYAIRSHQISLMHASAFRTYAQNGLTLASSVQALVAVAIAASMRAVLAPHKQSGDEDAFAARTMRAHPGDEIPIHDDVV